MKCTIRHMFETNSSSVHSLVYKNQVLSPSRLPVDPDTGEIIGRLGSFDCEFDYDDQESKLSYLLTCFYYQRGYDILDVKDSWYFNELEDMLIEYCGCTGLRIDGSSESDAYIDHQSVPEYFGSNDLLRYTQEEMKNFIFNDNVVLHSEYD